MAVCEPAASLSPQESRELTQIMVRRLHNLPSDREDRVFVGDEPPNGVTSLRKNNLKHVILARSGINSLFSSWMAWRGRETPLEPTGGGVAGAGLPEVGPSFSVRATIPFPPLNWPITGDWSGFMGPGLEWLTFMAANSPRGNAEMCAGIFMPVRRW